MKKLVRVFGQHRNGFTRYHYCYSDGTRYAVWFDARGREVQRGWVTKRDDAWLFSSSAAETT